MEHFLDFISDRTGLLIDKGGGQLSFIHLSFQEYLAAWLFTCQTASEESQRQFFESHLGHAAWEEVLLLRLYIILHLPGGGGRGLFDAVVSSLLRKMERQEDAPGWLTLGRAVRDNLEFSKHDTRTILQRLHEYWLQTPPRFDGDWFSVLEEICLFAPGAKGELARLLDEAWRQPDLARAAACLHLLDRLELSDGKCRIKDRPEFEQRTSDLLLTRGVDPGWRYTLLFVFDRVVTEFGQRVGIERLQEIAQRLNLPVDNVPRREPSDSTWNQVIVLGDCLQILAGRGAACRTTWPSSFRTASLRPSNRRFRSRTATRWRSPWAV